MKCKFLLRLFFGLLVLLAVFSCASAPPAEDTSLSGGGSTTPTPTPAPVLTGDAGPASQADLSALNAAVERAAAARKKAADFDAQTILPSDWQSADALYTDAERNRSTSTSGAAKESAARYNKAADAFDDLFDKIVSQYADKKRQELQEAREAAINAGARDLFPDYLLQADDFANEAEKKYLANDFYGFKNSADDAIAMYNTLKTIIEAQKLREEIEKMGFLDSDPAKLGLADKALDSAFSNLSANNYPSARNDAESALDQYNQVLFAAYEAYADAIAADAAEARQRALNYKANVAVKADFDAADAVYNRARTAYNSKTYDESGRLFNNSAAMFNAAADAAIEKQQRAEEALRRANEKVAESDEAAKNAELLLEGGVQ
jgi:hypothetical protein